METEKRYSPEVRERASGWFWSMRGNTLSRWAAVESVAGKIGCAAQSLLRWIAQAERDAGKRPV